MYQGRIPFSSKELLITEAPGLPVAKRAALVLLCVSAQPSTERLHCLKVCKQNLNWGIKAPVFDLPRTCGSPITWVLLLKTQVGAKPAVRLVPKAPSRMLELPASFLLSSNTESPSCVCLSVACKWSPRPDLCGPLPVLWYRPVFLACKYFYENFYASFLELLPPTLYYYLISVLNPSCSFMTHWLNWISVFCGMPHSFIHSLIHLISSSLTNPCISSGIHFLSCPLFCLWLTEPKETSSVICWPESQKYKDSCMRVLVWINENTWREQMQSSKICVTLPFPERGSPKVVWRSKVVFTEQISLV